MTDKGQGLPLAPLGNHFQRRMRRRQHRAAGFSFMTTTTAAPPAGEEMTAFSFLSQAEGVDPSSSSSPPPPPPVGDNHAATYTPSSGSDFILSSVSSSSPSSSSSLAAVVGSSTSDDPGVSEGSGFGFISSSSSMSTTIGDNGMADEVQAANTIGSAFSFIPSTGGADPVLAPLGSELGGGVDGDGGPQEKEEEGGGGSAFSFLSSSSSPAPPAMEAGASLLGLTEAGKPPPPPPGSSFSRDHSMDKLAQLEALMGMTTPTSITTSSSSSSSSLPSNGGGGSSSAALELSSLMSPAPPSPAVPITFERTATSKAGIRKKKTSVKVGYARDETDPIAPPPPPPSETPAPLPSSTTSAWPPTITTTTTTASSSSSLSSVVPDSAPFRRQPSSSSTSDGGIDQQQQPASLTSASTLRRSTSSSSGTALSPSTSVTTTSSSSTPVVVAVQAPPPPTSAGTGVATLSRVLQSSSVSQSPSIHRPSPPTTTTSSSTHRPSIDSPQQPHHEKKKPSTTTTSSSGSTGGGFFSSLFGGGSTKKEPESSKPSAPREAPAARAFPASIRLAAEEAAANARPSSINVTDSVSANGGGIRRSTSANSSSNQASTAPGLEAGGGNFSDDTGSEGEEDGSTTGTTTRRKSRGRLSSKASQPDNSNAPSSTSTHTSSPPEPKQQAASEPTPPSYPPSSSSSSRGAGTAFFSNGTDHQVNASSPTAATTETGSLTSSRFKRSNQPSTGQGTTTTTTTTSASPSSTMTQQQQPAEMIASKDPVERNRAVVEGFLKGFQKEATNLCFRQQELRRKQAKVTTEKQALVKQQASFQEELRRYEVEQQRLAEKEEFDRAEALQHVIDQVKQQTSKAAKSLQDITWEANQLEKDRVESVEEQRRLLDTIVSRLRDFLASRARELETFLLESSTSLEAEKKRLAAEEERILMEISNVDKDEASIKEEVDKVDKAILGQTADLYVRKEEVQARVAVVEDEIAKLEEQLRVKRAERERFLVELSSAEGEIAKVRGKFERPLARLKEKERVLLSSRRDVEAERTVLEEHKAAHGLSATAGKAEEGRLKTLIEHVSMELQVADVLSTTFLSQEQYQKNLEDDHAAGSSAVTLLQELQVEVAEAEEQSHMVQKEHERLQGLITSLREEVDGIDAKLPVLEQSKKESAAARNYKEAGNRSKEIKAMQTRREEAEAELGQAREEVEGVRHSLAEKQDVLGKCLERLREKERETESRKIGVLARKVKELRRARAGLGKLGAAKIQTSAELMIQAELEAAEAERDALSKRYGIAVVDDDDDDGEEGERPEEAEERKAVAEEEEEDEAVLSPKDEVEKGEDDVNKGVSTSSEVLRHHEDDDGEAVALPPPPTPPPAAAGPEAIAKARELHLHIIALEEKLQVAAAEEDYERADEINGEIDGCKAQIAALGPIDLVDLIMGMMMMMMMMMVVRWM